MNTIASHPPNKLTPNTTHMRTHPLTRAAPVQLGAYVLDASSNTDIATFGRPATIRCLAGGVPRPTVTWWRGHTMLAIASKRHQMAKDYSLTLANVSLSDLGAYTCQAYTGAGKPATLTLTLQAYGPVHTSRPSDQPFLRYVVNRQQAPTTTTTQAPRRPPVIYVEPQRTVQQPRGKRFGAWWG